MSKRKRNESFEGWDSAENRRLLKKLISEERANAVAQAAASVPSMIIEPDIPAPTRKPLAPSRTSSKPVVRVVTPKTRDDELMIVDNATTVDLAVGTTYKRISSELKAIDTVSPFGNASVAPWQFFDPPNVFTPLNTITTGTAAWNRTTRQICLKSLQINGLLHMRESPDATLFSVQQCKFLIIYDKQCNGALPQSTDVWLDQVNTPLDTNVSNSYSLDNLNNEGRFIYIWAKQINLPGARASGQTGIVNGMVRDLTAKNPRISKRTFEINEFIELEGLITTYRADSTPVGSIGDISTGSLLFVTWGDGDTVSSKWEFTGSLRLRFYDC